MSKTYAELQTEIREIESQQRELVAKDNATQDEQDHVWLLEGKVSALRERANEIHEHEVEEARRAAGTTLTASKGDYDGGFIRSFVASGGKETDLEYRNLVTTTGSGSYLVPQEWHNTVESYRFEANFMRQLARVIRTESTHNIPVLTTLASPTVVGENTAYTSTDPTIGQVILSAYKLTSKTVVSEELLADAAYNVDAELARAYGESFGAAEETLFMTGNGSSTVTGVFNKTADKTFASASAITPDELIECAYGLARQYRDGGVWMMDDTTALYIAKLKESVSTSGTTPYWWTNASQGEPARLLGFPVYTNSGIANITNSAKVICFGNPQYYVIGDRGGLNLKRLELNEYGTTFALAARLDAKPLDASAFYVAAMHA